MHNSAVIGLVTLACFTALSFLERKTKVRWKKLLWFIFFVLTIFLIILQTKNSFIASKEIKDLKKTSWQFDEQGNVMPPP